MRTIIFDFDGTIADTLAITVAIYNQLAQQHGFKLINPADLEILRSHPELRSVMRTYGISIWKLPKLVQAVRTNMKQHLAELKPHTGILEAIRQLQSSGVTVGILTSNSVDNVRTFLKQHQAEDLFSFIESYHRVFGKHVALKRIVKQLKLDQQSTYYVGDETRDMVAAQRAGIHSVAVTWGFQTHQALAAATPEIIIDQPAELTKSLQ